MNMEKAPDWLQIMTMIVIAALLGAGFFVRPEWFLGAIGVLVLWGLARWAMLP